MDSDAFLNKISEIHRALELDLYNCALALALTLPDICGKVEFPNENDSKAYKEWFKKYAEPLFTFPTTVLPGGEIINYTCFTNEECWALRCAVLHAGNYDVKRIPLSKVSFHAHKRDGKNYSHMVRNTQDADFDVIDICQKICNAAEQYYLNIKDRARFSIDEVRIVVW